MLHIRPEPSGWRLRAGRAQGAPIDRRVEAGANSQSAVRTELVSVLTDGRIDALAFHLPRSLRFDRIAPFLGSVAEVGRRLQLERAIELRTADIGGLRFMAAPEVLVESSGKLAPAQLRSVMRGAYMSFSECFLRSQPERPCGAVSATVQFVIDRDGRVVASSVEVSGVQSPKLNACFAAQAKDLVFPKPEAGTVSVSQLLVW